MYFESDVLRVRCRSAIWGINAQVSFLSEKSLLVMSRRIFQKSSWQVLFTIWLIQTDSWTRSPLISWCVKLGWSHKCKSWRSTRAIILTGMDSNAYVSIKQDQIKLFTQQTTTIYRHCRPAHSPNLSWPVRASCTVKSKVVVVLIAGREQYPHCCEKHNRFA